MIIHCKHTKTVPLDELVPNPKNPNTHSKEQIKRLSAVLQWQGWRSPIVVSNSSGFIVKGHGRLAAARKAGFECAPVDFQDYESEAQEWADLIADNRLAELAEWDEAGLNELLQKLNQTDIDVELSGFTESELDDLLGELGETETTEDNFDEEPPTIPQTKLGDLYELNNHRIQCGDSTDLKVVEKTLAGQSPDLMVTDPPYGVEYDADWRNRVKRPDGTPYGASAVGAVENDDLCDWTPAWKLFEGSVAYVWHAGKFAPIVFQSLEATELLIRSQIIWAKDRFAISRGHYHWQHEPCWFAVKKGRTANWAGGRKQTTLWQIGHQKSETGHSTQKPIEAMARPIRNHKGDVYDPFLGSGTTLIAAEQLNRTCYGQELSPEYCDLIVRRWAQYMQGEGKKYSVKVNGKDITKASWIY
tara:strand:- start:2643 stop:3890 length:1248 start_codon:yes stop_codon:yes gene_type:complete